MASGQSTKGRKASAVGRGERFINTAASSHFRTAHCGGNTPSHEEGKELQKSQVIQLGRPMARISVFDEDTAGTNQRRLVQHVEIRLLGLHVSEYSRDVRNSQRRGFNLKTGEGVKMAE